MAKMKGRASLNNQSKRCFDDVWSEGRSKHFDKIKGLYYNAENPFIYSYSYRSDLISTSMDLNNWLKKNYPDVKRLDQIRTEHLQKYLDGKAKTCSKKTVQKQKSHLVKLFLIYKNKFKTVSKIKSEDLINNAKDIESDRKVYETEDVFRLLKGIEGDEKTKIKNKIYVAMRLSLALGLRASEIINLRSTDFNFKKNLVHIRKSKGGKSRFVPMKSKDISFIKLLLKDKNSNEKLVNYKNQKSLNTIFNRYKKEILGQKSHQKGFHSFRKIAAQEYFDMCRESGMTKQKALSATSVYLGHGPQRDNKLMSTYINHIY